MTKLKDKIENALNESRTLILGVQVLVGFQYQSVFESGFERLAPPTQTLKVVGLSMMLIALGLLMSPAPYHRLVAKGYATPGVHRFTTVVTAIALFPFALGLVIEFYIAVGIVTPLPIAVGGGLFLLGFTLLSWYGLEVIARMRRQASEKAQSRAKKEKQKK
jgi:hypothetical protein